MASQNLRKLAELRENEPPQFFETDPLVIKARLVAKFEADTKKTLYEGHPEMFAIETMAYGLSVHSESEQDAVLQNTIVWATEKNVEYQAAQNNVFRLLATHAQTTLTFTRDVDNGEIITIEKGFEVSGNGAVFKTEADLVLPIGTMNAGVAATATASGPSANGHVPFTLITPESDLPEGIIVHNSTTTFGGADIEDLERLRERGVNGNFTISVGGPGNGYRELVKGIHPDIVSVEIVKPQPGYMVIYPLMRDGVPTDEMRDFILEQIDPEEDVPMGDYLTCVSPSGQEFTFSVIVRLDAIDPTMEDRVKAKVQEIFHNWTQRLGLRISPSHIISEVKKLPGVLDVELTGLAYTDLAKTEFAILGEFTVDVQVTPNV